MPSLIGVEQLNANLKLIQNWTAVSLKEGMEKSLNLIEVSAKADHWRGESLSREAVIQHEAIDTEEERFYTWTGQLVGGIHAEDVKVTLTGLSGAVVSTEPYSERVEIGSPNSRAFPFMGPALYDNGQQIVIILGAAVQKVIK